MVGDSANENLFSKLGPHLCEKLDWEPEELGPLYLHNMRIVRVFDYGRHQLTSTGLQAREFTGNTNSELFFAYKNRPPSMASVSSVANPDKNQAGSSVVNSQSSKPVFPSPLEKWIIQPSAISEKVRTNVNQLGDVFKAKYPVFLFRF